MQCPKCNVTLQMTERQNVEVDYCPQCRGIWLDRGELDKIIDRMEQSQPAPARREEPRREEYRQEHYHKPYRKKKESWLSDIFDF